MKLAGWVKAMKAIYVTNVKLKPILEKLAEGEQMLIEGQALLDKLNNEKNDCEQKCDRLFKEAQACQQRKEEVANNLEMNKQRLIRATKLLSGLKDEKERWTNEVSTLNANINFLIGNCVIASGVLS